MLLPVALACLLSALVRFSSTRLITFLPSFAFLRLPSPSFLRSRPPINGRLVLSPLPHCRPCPAPYVLTLYHLLPLLFFGLPWSLEPASWFFFVVVFFPPPLSSPPDPPPALHYCAAMHGSFNSTLPHPAPASDGRLSARQWASRRTPPPLVLLLLLFTPLPLSARDDGDFASIRSRFPLSTRSWRAKELLPAASTFAQRERVPGLLPWCIRIKGADNYTEVKSSDKGDYVLRCLPSWQIIGIYKVSRLSRQDAAQRQARLSRLMKRRGASQAQRRPLCDMLQDYAAAAKLKNCQDTPPSHSLVVVIGHSLLQRGPGGPCASATVRCAHHWTLSPSLAQQTCMKDSKCTAKCRPAAFQGENRTTLTRPGPQTRGPTEVHTRFLPPTPFLRPPKVALLTSPSCCSPNRSCPPYMSHIHNRPLRTMAAAQLPAGGRLSETRPGRRPRHEPIYLWVAKPRRPLSWKRHWLAACQPFSYAAGDDCRDAARSTLRCHSTRPCGAHLFPVSLRSRVSATASEAQHQRTWQGVLGMLVSLVYSPEIQRESGA